MVKKPTDRSTQDDGAAMNLPGTTTQAAVNILEASIQQRDAVSKAFEAQKTALKEAVTAQKATAMQQLAKARKALSAQEAEVQIQAARSATENLAALSKKALAGNKPAGGTGDKTPAGKTSLDPSGLIEHLTEVIKETVITEVRAQLDSMIKQAEAAAKENTGQETKAAKE